MHNSPFNMRQYNLSVLKPPVSKSAAGSSSSKASMSYTTAAKSLDLLRQNIQRNINQEIQSVISKYIDIFFKPGIENIRNNLGPESVTDDHVTNMCRQILEEAKRMYPVPVYTNASSASPPSVGNTNSSVTDSSNNESEQPFSVQVSSVHTQQSQTPNPPNNNPVESVKLPLTSPSFGVKRESDTDSEASCMSNASKKVKKSGNKSSNGTSASTSSDNSGTNNSNSTSSTNSSSPSKPKKPSGPSRKHVAMWDTTKLTTETMFIMGAKANKALGFAQTRGRLYVKHPGLFKYASDSDDKEWLSKNKLMPATGGRAYIMLLEDIEKLAKDNKLNVTINYDDIKGFRVPDFILDKMKSYISTWKKTYAEETQKTTTNRNRNTNANKPTNATPTSTPTSQPTLSNSIPNSVPNLNLNNPPASSMAQINIPQPTIHSQTSLQQSQQQHPNSHGQPPNINYMNSVAQGNVLFDTQFSSSQPHELTDYMHIETKPPPMYPGHSSQPQQQHSMQPMSNPGNANYVHANQLDPIEQALTKGDWSQVSDRSLLQYALQSTRNIGSWDPQDSFDLIESVTNGGLTGGSGLGETSPLLQISPDAGAHLTAPPLGPVSPNCELSAVLDQVTAFQYSTET